LLAPRPLSVAFAAAMKEGLDAVMNGEVCVIDVRVLPGYDTDASGERPPGRG
jgi:hypothetical protein